MSLTKRMTLAATDLKLQSRIDDFSFQVSAESDTRFWFRLERQVDRDVITDFLSGSLAPIRAVSAFVSCYQHLGLAPRKVIVFKNILAPKLARNDGVTAARALYDAQRFYAACGRAALLSLGELSVEETLERTRGKYDLIVRAP
ncbi:MAG TPA: hypothetical protein VG826_22335 [Pirellulales bacterium]|nr:hypothetical protein [Pirellulales bacterium]